MAKKIRKRKVDDPLVDADHSPLKMLDIIVDTGAGGYESSGANGEISSSKQYTPPPPPKRSKGSHKSRPTTQAKTRKEEVNSAKTESQHFIELVKYSSKKRESGKDHKCLIEFRKLLETQHEHFSSELGGKEAQSIYQRDEFAKKFSSAYASVRFTYTVHQDNEQIFEHYFDSPAYALQQESVDRIKRAYSLMEQFQSCSTDVASQEISSFMNSNWESGVKNLRCILDIGRQIGERKADCILRGGRASCLDNEAAEASKLLYGEDILPTQMVTWAEIARKQEKRVMRLANILPQD